jgi:hypothetical protein
MLEHFKVTANNIFISVTKHSMMRTNVAAPEKLKNLKPAQFD